MATNYYQTDTSATFNVGCSGATGGTTTDARTCSTASGDVGASAYTVNTGNNVTRAVFAWELPKPGTSSWEDGTWSIPINFTTGDAGTTLNAVYVCDKNGGSYSTVCSETGLSVASTSGLTTRSIPQGGAWTPQSSTDSQPFIVVVLTNTDTHGGSSVAITSNQTISAPLNLASPITGTGAAALPVLAAAGVGDVVVDGTGMGALPTLTAAGAGGVLVDGAGVGALPSLAAAGVATVLVTGDGVGALPSLSAAGTGGSASSVTGTGTAALPSIASTGSVTVLVTGAGAAPVPSLAAGGTGAVDVVGAGIVGLPPLAASGSGVVLVDTDGGSALPSLMAAGSGTVLIVSNGSVVLPSMNAAGGQAGGGNPGQGKGRWRSRFVEGIERRRHV